MSTASEGIPTDHAARTGQPPGALAMLAATALGGVIVSRMNKTPLVLAAGAAALALLNRKKASPQPLAPTRAPAPEPVPAPPPVQVQSQVEQWLTQQIHREASAPVVTLPPAVSIEPEDDYIPQSLLADDTAEITATAPPNDAFASLTEPVFRQPPAAPRRFEPEPAFPALQALEATESCPTSDAAWILGVEPLPSLNESAAPLSLASSMFATEPVPMTHLAAPVVFSAPVFEGGALPDEIEVAPQAEPIMHLTPTLPPEPATAPEVELVCETAALAEVQEIPVQIAAPGEASFDPPLATVPDHPWSSPVAAPSPQTSTFGPVVEAEIVLRPRAPTQAAVVAKTRPVSSRFAKAAVAAAAPADGEEPVLGSAPQPSPHEPQARTTWRSWWRGD